MESFKSLVLSQEGNCDGDGFVYIVDSIIISRTEMLKLNVIEQNLQLYAMQMYYSLEGTL